MLGDKTILKLTSTEIIKNVASKHSGIKLDINIDRNLGNSQIYSNFIEMLLNNQWAKGEIKRKIMHGTRMHYAK